jgi:prepilin-type N-terminal cleavage/methylation domain-containing protein
MLKKLRAFTIVEVLVVIAILGILLALLVPAVQRAWESARKMRAKQGQVTEQREDQVPESFSYPCPHCGEPVRFLVINNDE